MKKNSIYIDIYRKIFNDGHQYMVNYLRSVEKCMCVHAAMLQLRRR
jgi:hypothetical protein